MDTKQEKEILKPLVEELIKFSSLPVQGKKKELWARHQAFTGTEQIPISVFYEGIPRPQWEFILGKGFLKTESATAQELELDLRKRLWAVKNIPDDHILWPFITLAAKISRPACWGIPVKWRGVDEEDSNPEHARRIDPPFNNSIDVSKIEFTDMDIATRETAKVINLATELVDDKISIFAGYSNLGFQPFDRAVEFRGLENIMLDVVDAPEKVKELLEIITENLIKHHLNREEKGWINAPTIDNKYLAFPMRVHAAYLQEGFNQRKLKLSDEWCYIGAQTSSGLGPEMYAEFVQPYNARLAELFPGKTVYYHGCENLDQKAIIIRNLPNLRRFHISPWSSIRAVREATKDSFIYEVHDHPGRVFFGRNKEDMKKEIKTLIADAGGCNFDLNLSDIHSVNKDPRLLKMWSEAAREAVEEADKNR